MPIKGIKGGIGSKTLGYGLGAVEAVAATDAEFSNTTLLLHGDGTNGGQNDTFIDSSTNNLTITSPGGATQGTFTPFLDEGQYSRYTDANTNQDAHGTGVSLGTSNFTIGMFVYPLGCDSVEGQALTAGGSSRTNLYADTGGETVILSHNEFLACYDGSGWEISISFTTAIALNQWQWIQVDRTGNTFRVSIDGSYVDGGGDTSSRSISTISTGTFGARAGQDRYLGYYNNFIIIVGANRGSITPPTTSLTADSNTKILMHQSNRLLNNGNTSVSLTYGSSNRIVPFSPIAPTTAYDSTTHLGSGHFGDETLSDTAADDNDDYIYADLPSAIGTGDMTAEFWYYPTKFYNYIAPFSVNDSGGDRTDGFNIGSDSGAKLKMVDTSAGNDNFESSNNVIKKFEWNHIAMVRSGSIVRMFQNGVQIGTKSNTNNWSGTRVAIATRADALNQETTTGYIANCNLVVGTAKYGSSGYTVPTSPITAHANTKFLVNFVNAEIIDNSMKNNLITSGNTQIDTSVKKFGTGSIKFDGVAGSTLKIPYSRTLNVDSGDFTIEFFIYFTSATGYKTVYSQGYNGAGGVLIQTNQDVTGLRFYLNNTQAFQSDNFTLNTWYHVAWIRSGTDSKLFIDGTQNQSTATSYTHDGNSTENAEIGQATSGWSGTVTGGPYPFSGYIDEFRITKGVARYPSNFTAPTQAFANNG